jgi:hypothetical protein
MTTTQLQQRQQHVPSEVLIHCFEYLNDPIEYVRNVSLVNKQFHLLVIPYRNHYYTLSQGDAHEEILIDDHLNDMSQLIWRNFTFNYWKCFSRKMKVSNWYKLFRKRFKCMQQVKKETGYEAHVIEHCSQIETDCPLLYELVPVSSDRDSARFCNTCFKSIQIAVNRDMMQSFENLGYPTCFIDLNDSSILEQHAESVIEVVPQWICTIM